MIATTGEVKVTDFGLARAEVSATAATRALGPRRIAAAAVANGVGTLLGSPLTQTGALVGTPAYMAPEQIAGGAKRRPPYDDPDASGRPTEPLGEAVDARTDQFSFCIALFEALDGERPFRGASPEALFEATLSGTVRELKRRRGVSSRIERAIRRGLRVSPAERFPDMDALLAELTPGSRRTMLALGAAGVVAAGATVAVLATRSPSPPNGATVVSKVASAWTVARACLVGQTPAAGDAAQAIAARDVTIRDEESCEATLEDLRDTVGADDTVVEARRSVRELVTAYAAHRKRLASTVNAADTVAAAFVAVDAAVAALDPAWQPAVGTADARRRGPARREQARRPAGAGRRQGHRARRRRRGLGDRVARREAELSVRAPPVLVGPHVASGCGGGRRRKRQRDRRRGIADRRRR
jgi:hypothetical protein